VITVSNWTRRVTGQKEDTILKVLAEQIGERVGCGTGRRRRKKRQDEQINPKFKIWGSESHARTAAKGKSTQLGEIGGF